MEMDAMAFMRRNVCSSHLFIHVAHPGQREQPAGITTAREPESARIAEAASVRAQAHRHRSQFQHREGIPRIQAPWSSDRTRCRFETVDPPRFARERDSIECGQVRRRHDVDDAQKVERVGRVAQGGGLVAIARPVPIKVCRTVRRGQIAEELDLVLRRRSHRRRCRWEQC